MKCSLCSIRIREPPSLAPSYPEGGERATARAPSHLGSRHSTSHPYLRREAHGLKSDSNLRGGNSDKMRADFPRGPLLDRLEIAARSQRPI